jgi:hypothetical protein
MYTLKWKQKSEFVVFAPDSPLKTNMDSLEMATGKLQHVGGLSPT